LVTLTAGRTVEQLPSFIRLTSSHFWPGAAFTTAALNGSGVSAHLAKDKLKPFTLGL
jgi:hypothetical protein